MRAWNIDELRGRLGVVMVVAMVGVWGLLGCDSSRDGAGLVTTTGPKATAIVEQAKATPTLQVPTQTPPVALPTATLAMDVATQTPRVVTPTQTPSVAVPTPTSHVAVLTAAPREVQATMEVYRDGPGVGFETCGNKSFPWGPRFDYDVVVWSPDGSELYLTDAGAVHGVTADGWRLWPIARAWPPEAEGNLSSRQGWTSFAVAPDGIQLVYVACVVSTTDTVRPDGQRIIVRSDGTVEAANGFHYDLFRVINDGTEANRLTETGAVEFYPAWSPDGLRIAFLSDAERFDTGTAHPGWGLYTMAADGTDIRPALDKEIAVLHQPPQWSPDGRHLAVVRYMAVEIGRSVQIIQSGRELVVLGADGAEPWRLATDVVSGPSWSPDGQRLAYARANSDGVALYTVHADGTNETRISDILRWQAPTRSRISTAKHGVDEDPAEAWIDTVAWSPDGTRILVRSNDQHPTLVVNLESGQTTEIGVARRLSPNGSFEGVRAAAWSPDGSRIALIADGKDYEGPGVVATVAADGTDLRVLAERENPAYSGTKLLAQRARYVPGPEDEAACRTGGAVPNPDVNEWLVEQCVDLIRLRKSLVGGEALELES